ncbi:chemotaxis protein CheW [Devosia marina]|uniref:Chemotaxis protein CheW n=1 Tax=Devosia marina TaxID=2683198 RepID=A0A7X3FUC3_9HYPH|nr:chemotaxis protein CheW [Devosia marina]MVT00826.1 chemotaxis protein CheW [Devosia marina]
MAEQTQYVTLGVAEELFAAPVEKVQEILDMRDIARLPQSPEALMGMIDVRGQGVPVVDLRLTLGLPGATDTENTRIIVLALAGEGRDRRLGLRADRVFEVTTLDDGALDPAPSVSGQWSGRCIAGIGRGNGRFVTVLDLERLLGDFEAATSQSA